MPQSEIVNESAFFASHHPDTGASYSVFVALHMNADVSRVLHALAIPEYMEAWMQVPGADRVECNPDRRSFDRFRMDLFVSGAHCESIHGSCFLSKPNRITYIFERDRGSQTSRSLVEIRLWNHAGGCTLRLSEIGLASDDERQWHEKMWQRSFRKLRGLLEGTAGTWMEVAAERSPD
jgi:uncharacterized protein YndB with AHSA1/START domain